MKINLSVLTFAILTRTVLSTPHSSRSYGTPISYTNSTWIQYGVDDWLTKFIAERNIPVANFLSEFPKAVGSSIDCRMDHPCTTVPPISTDAAEEDININLILTGLTHFNDLFRTIHRLYNSATRTRDFLIDSVSGIYHDFTPTNLNSTMPASDIAHALFNPTWYLPNALPNAALMKVVHEAIDLTAEKGFGYPWELHANYTVSQEYTNLQWSLRSASDAWVAKYHEVVTGTNEITILDFLRDGAMLRMDYAKNMKNSTWALQAMTMFQRQIFSIVLEANGLLVHRASYENMTPVDASMNLIGSHDDPYSRVIYEPIHWGVDESNNITREYLPGANFNEVTTPRVIYGQSWSCFQATNTDEFKTNFAKPWEQPGYDEKSLYIDNWDGTADMMDKQDPLCTFNIPVNDQPSDPKQSPFVQKLEDACPDETGHFKDSDQFDYDIYDALMIASDAWASAQIAALAVDPNYPAKLQDFCDASEHQFHQWEIGEAKSFGINFGINLAFGLVFHWSGVKADAISKYSSLKGFFSKAFQEKPPVVVDPPAGDFSVPEINPDEDSGYHMGLPQDHGSEYYASDAPDDSSDGQQGSTQGSVQSHDASNGNWMNVLHGSVYDNIFDGDLADDSEK